jgi:hypothetical protein
MRKGIGTVLLVTRIKPIEMMACMFQNTEEGFVCHREKGFEFKPPRTRQKRQTKKELEKNGREGR